MSSLLILSKEKLVMDMIEGFQGLFGDKILKKIIKRMLDACSNYPCKVVMLIMAKQYCVDMF